MVMVSSPIARSSEAARTRLGTAQQLRPFRAANRQVTKEVYQGESVVTTIL